MKILDKSSFWSRSLFFTLAQRVSMMFFSVATFYVLTHHLFTIEQVGVYAILQVVIVTIEMIKLGLLRNATVKLLQNAEMADRKTEVLSVALFINITVSVFAILFILFGGGWLSTIMNIPDLKFLLLISIPLVVLQIPTNHFEIIQQASLQFKATFQSYFLRQSLFFLFVVLVLLIDKTWMTVERIQYGLILIMILTNFLFYLQTKPLLNLKYKYNHDVLKRLLSFGKYVFGTSLFSQVYRYSDLFISAVAFSDPVVGLRTVSYYSAVSRVTNVMDVPFMAVADVLFPKNAQVIEGVSGKETVKYYFERMVGTLTALILPASLFIAVIAKYVILIIAGNKYLPSVPILQIIMLFTFLRPFFTQFGFTMDSIGKPKVNFYVNILLLIVSFGSTYLSVQWFGLMGPAYASIFTWAFACTIF
ncbi:MAG: oligosaccharide flippase family protein, partial [Flavihumibacter sp.]|nr:oligosaccharide flippase family protein [Flavihumibacter sp.]